MKLSFNRLLFTSILLVLVVLPLQADKIGYAFSGGGARGFAHIGVLKVLEEAGIQPDYISGSSIGAIIGAMSAMGYNASEIEAMCLKLDWDSLTRDIHQRRELYIGQKRWSPYGNVVFELNDTWVPQLPSSVFVGNNINLELFRWTAAASQVKDFSKLPIAFACNATNLLTGEPVTFTAGSLMQALRASMSIPSLVKPFQIGDNLYIDGGVSQNMPVNLLQDMGAELIIGIKVNSTLRTGEKLNNLVEILDQTINIGITRNLNEHLEACDLLIEPDLSTFSATDYSKLKDIIAAGEKSARDQLEQILTFKASLAPKNEPKLNQFDKSIDQFFISRIEVHGNEHVSAAKVIEYLGLHKQRTYSTDAIYQACLNTWNSQAFSTIYPVLQLAADGSYVLEIHIKERDRKDIALNMAYCSDDKLSAGVVLTLNNYLLKNSKLLSEVKLGGKNEFNLDYVKNFGEQWGAYYRLFGFLNEKTIYNYFDHHKVNSVKSLEVGMTSGLGVFARDIAIAELFVYGNNTKLYSEISPTPEIPKYNTISGFGIKGYHESLDNYIFPSQGLRIYNKFNFSRNLELSDIIYSSYQGKGELYLPLYKGISMDTAINYGSYFNSDANDTLDPFIIGGSDGFMGYSRYEISAPYYQIVNLGLSARLLKRWWLAMGTQALRYADSDVWGVQKSWELCAYTGIGFNSVIMPVKLYLALNEAGKVNSLLSIGYDFDIFRFSRK